VSRKKTKREKHGLLKDGAALRRKNSGEKIWRGYLRPDVSPGEGLPRGIYSKKEKTGDSSPYPLLPFQNVTQSQEAKTED